MRNARVSRRQSIWLAIGPLLAGRSWKALAQSVPIEWSYPMALAGGVLGDGCGIFHGYACENIPFYPGLWHTGENWSSKSNSASHHQ